MRTPHLTEEGWPRHQEDVAKPPLRSGRGGRSRAMFRTHSEISLVSDHPEAVKKMRSGLRSATPLLASPQGGVAASSRKMSRSHRSGRSRGGFPFASIGKPPRPRDQRRLRDIFLIARPPLLAVMQGGEWPARNMVAIFFTASPSAPLRRLRDIFLVAQPPLLCEEGSSPASNLCGEATLMPIPLSVTR